MQPLFDMSGFDQPGRSHGHVVCWPAVPPHVQERAKELMRELRSLAPGLSVEVKVWHLSEMGWVLGPEGWKAPNGK